VSWAPRLCRPHRPPACAISDRGSCGPGTHQRAEDVGRCAPRAAHCGAHDALRQPCAAACWLVWSALAHGPHQTRRRSGGPPWARRASSRSRASLKQLTPRAHAEHSRTRRGSMRGHATRAAPSHRHEGGRAPLCAKRPARLVQREQKREPAMCSERAWHAKGRACTHRFSATAAASCAVQNFITASHISLFASEPRAARAGSDGGVRSKT
jgi:hypothetical protein